MARRHRGVLVTLKRDGGPQLSNVGHVYDGTRRRIRISSTDDRAEVRNLRRDPRASFYVTTDDQRRRKNSLMAVPGPHARTEASSERLRANHRPRPLSR
nr:pyridoxamine 5'-phosphate oxidase family protein [Planosporangium mesophilum]